jgi:hypothetical protein
MRVAGWACCVALLSSLAAGAASAAEKVGNPLADQVRAANSRFKDVSVAVAEGYAPIPCTSGVEGGAAPISRMRSPTESGRKQSCMSRSPMERWS